MFVKSFLNMMMMMIIYQPFTCDLTIRSNGRCANIVCWIVHGGAKPGLILGLVCTVPPSPSGHDFRR